MLAGAFARGEKGAGQTDLGQAPSIRVRRLWIAAAVVFALLMGIALFLSLRTEHHIEQNRAAGHAARQYGTLLGAIEAQEVAAHEFLIGDSEAAGAREEFDGLSSQARGGFADLRSDGGDSREEAARLSPLYESFVKATHSLFAAVDRGQTERAEAIEVGEVNPAYEALVSQTAALTTENADTADRSSSRLEAVSETMLVVLPISFLLAGVGLILLGRAGRRSERAEAEARAELKLQERAALTDSLTGLRNHRAFEEDLAAMVAKAERTESSLCLVSLDVDGLKRVNDTLGHPVGDRNLRQVAAALLTVIVPPERAYRVGGDEFALLLPGGGAWTGYGAVERVRGELQAAEADVDVAAGVAEAEPPQGRVDLVRNADVALINAKRTHRGVIIHSAELDGSIGGPIPPDEHHLQVLSTALARAVDAKDSYTRSHSETVSNLCVLIGSELGLEPERLAKLRIAGLLHDVGKIGTPDAILNKPGDLTAEEYEKLKEHPVLGEEILTAADLELQANWIRHHHERPDGRGYPDGLRGDRVPLESRIIGVADAFEAMISNRPYRSGRSEREALAELQRHAGTQFDPDCVAAVRRGLRDGTLSTEATVAVNGDEPEPHARAAEASSPV